MIPEGGWLIIAPTEGKFGGQRGRSLTETVNQTPVWEEQMAQGLLSQKALRRGDVISGSVVSIDREGAWVNIGAKTEGIIPIYEMATVSSQRPLRVEETVEVLVLQPEREDGRAVLSLDGARRQRGWQELNEYLNSGELLKVEITQATRGGLVASYEGIQGFIPNSQVAGQRDGKADVGEDWLAQRKGQWAKVKIIELDRPRHRLIFSERLALREQREKERERVVAELNEGEVRHGRVTGIHNFGAFVDLGGVEGLVPASEISWQRDSVPAEAVSLGQEVDVSVMRVDRENKRVVLSLRRLQPHPWEAIHQKYQVGQRVTATVTKLVPFGAFARLDGSIEGLIHISELAPRHIIHPKEVVREGDVLEVKVLSIDPERRHLRLSLRQAQEEF